jgi:hypothetical protein
MTSTVWWNSGSLLYVLAITRVVWRHLLVGAREDRRRWPSLTVLAEELGLGVSTVHKALAQPVEIEAVRVSRLGGVELFDPYRLLLMFAAKRRLQRDIVVRQWVASPAERVEALAARNPRMTVGGFGAVITHLGHNPIASYTTALIYGDPAFAEELPDGKTGEGAELVIVQPDPWLERYGRVTPFAQAYADLFSLPGWQAARFIEEIDPWTIATSRERELVA